MGMVLQSSLKGSHTLRRALIEWPHCVSGVVPSEGSLFGRN